MEREGLEEKDGAFVGQVIVQNEFGLHARPAGKLAQEARKYVSRIALEYDGRLVDAKSILDLLTLAAPRGTELTLRVKGEDAMVAFPAICLFFENHFSGEPN